MTDFAAAQRLLESTKILELCKKWAPGARRRAGRRTAAHDGAVS